MSTFPTTNTFYVSESTTLCPEVDFLNDLGSIFFTKFTENQFTPCWSWRVYSIFWSWLVSRKRVVVADKCFSTNWILSIFLLARSTLFTLFVDEINIVDKLFFDELKCSKNETSFFSFQLPSLFFQRRRFFDGNKRKLEIKHSSTFLHFHRL